MTATLTAEQRDLWDRMDMGRSREPTPGQTLKQQEHWAIECYLHWCWLDVIDPPDRAVLEKLIGSTR